MIKTYTTKKTVLGTMNELQSFTGLAPTYDKTLTLNALHGIYPNEVPVNRPAIKYFGIGIGGVVNADDGFLSKVVPATMTNCNAYRPVPHRCRLVEQDLSPEERAKYRMRVKETINGNEYYCYYLKEIEFPDNGVVVTRTDSTTGNSVPFTLDPSYLQPTPPELTTDGSIGDMASEVNVTLACRLPINSSEVLEYINAMYGDPRYARISEFTIFSGEDKVVSGEQNGESIQYTESMLTQLAIHYTFDGVLMTKPNVTETNLFNLGKTEVLIQS